MIKEPFNLNASLNEYAFARFMEDTNLSLAKAGRPVIMASQCRDIHSKLVANLASKPSPDGTGYTLSSAGQSVFMRSFREVMMDPKIQETIGSYNQNYYEAKLKPDGKTRYQRYMAEYSEITGFELTKEGAAQRRAGTQPLDNYIPISPFQESYASRTTVLNHGTEILYAAQKDMIGFQQRTDGTFVLSNLRNQDAQEQDVDFYQRKPASNGGFNYRKAGKAYTYEDAVGLSRLRPYMTDADYKACASWMNVDAKDRMSPQAMDRSVSILQMLTEEGVPYKVSRDRDRGQLKVDVSNTKLSIRLTETRANESFIGRGYRDGIAMYIGPSRRLQPGETYTPSVADTQLVVQYMLGQQPKRVNNYSSLVDERVGGPAVNKYKRDGKMESYNQSYVSVKDNKVSLRTAAGFSSKIDGKKALPLSVLTKNNRSSAHMNFATQESAVDFLKESIDSAKRRFEELVDVDMLVREAAEHGDDENYVPAFSSDAGIAPIQQTYWDVLTGKSELYRPTEKVTDETFAPLFDALGLLDEEEEGENTPVDHTDTINGEQMYTGTPEHKIRQHLNESMDVLFGSYEPDMNGKRFNPSLVASFMESPNGIYRNNDNIVAAMYKLEFTGDELRGDDFQTGAMKDRLLRFDKDSAVRMDSLESPFMRTMYEQVKGTLETTCCRVNPEDILIDQNGVVHYTAYQSVGTKFQERKVEGMVGQIFEPDADGLIETRYNGSQNRLFSPGYNAYIQMPDGNSGPNFMERVRLRGLSQVMAENIAETIRNDLIGGDEEPILSETGEQIGVSIGTTTNINNTYRGLYTTGYKVNVERQEGESLKDAYIRQCEMTGMPRDILQAVWQTAANTYRFSNEYRDGSTVDAEARFNRRALMENESVHDLTNNNVMNYYNMTNHTNLAVTQSGSLGYSDDIQTGSGKNQGATRVLGVGVQVNPKTGEIIPVRDASGNLVRVESPLRALLTEKFGPDVDAKPADRAQMVTSNLQSASGVAGWGTHITSQGKEVNGVGVAQLTLQGLTFDDGAVISKKFAESNPVVMESGKSRPLMPGDKICDFAGNKSIVAKIIDPEMDLAEAEEQGIKESVELFRMNPDLDVVQAPYSAVSRFNAAGAKLAMRTPMELKLPDGTTHDGCLGFAPMIITKHTANDHTKLYSEEQDVPSNEVKGRKISAQLGWVLTAKGSTALMDEIYSTNNKAVSDFREYLNVMGLDMDEVGALRKEYQPHEGEERHVFQLPDDDTIKNTPEKDLINLFRDAVDSKGGFLEIPFEVTLPSGEKTQQIPPEQASRQDRPMYQLPVLSSHLRSGQTFEDGTSQVHDYTNQYARIFAGALKYMKAEMDMSEAQAAGNEKAVVTQQGKMYAAQNEVASSYAVITDSVRNRKFETKHNIMRDEFMAKRMPHSATAVWTPDTNLNLNQVAMNEDMMKNMGVKEGDYVMLWRDPILRDYGARYMEVKRDDNLCGIAVHPLCAVAFDGDFDGDSVGMWKPSRESSKREAMAQYSFENTMLDFTQKRENGDYALIFNTGMDVVSAEVEDEARAAKIRLEGEVPEPTLRERRMELEHRANEIYRSNMSPEERLAANREVLDGLSDWARDTLCHTCGTEIVSYNNLQDHMQSLVTMVDHGAKGSHKKLEHYAHYLGVDYAKSSDGHILPETVKDAGKSLITEKDIADTEKATAIKSHGTGNAGAVSQRMVMFMRNLGFEAPSTVDDGKATQQSTLSSALQLTYLATQGILQAKHDPVQAQVLYDSVKGPIREIWRGHALERKDTQDGPVWVTKRQQNALGENVPIQATKDEWIESFMALHTDKDGLDLGGAINEDHVRQVADALYNPDTGRMYDMEDPETIAQVAAPMDRLAYSITNAFQTLCDMADKGTNIFEGKCNAMFMPKNISKNMEILAENQAKMERGELPSGNLHEGMRSITKTDTQAGYEAKVSAGNSVIDLHSESSIVAEAKGYDTGVGVDEPVVSTSIPLSQNTPDVDENVAPKSSFDFSATVEKTSEPVTVKQSAPTTGRPVPANMQEIADKDLKQHDGHEGSDGLGS